MSDEGLLDREGLLGVCGWVVPFQTDTHGRTLWGVGMNTSCIRREAVTRLGTGESVRSGVGPDTSDCTARDGSCSAGEVRETCL